MSAIHDLIAQIGDSRLRERLALEWAQASQEKKFGLVFEDHLPELIPLYGCKPIRGDLVCKKNSSLSELWQVKSINKNIATCIKRKDLDKKPEDLIPTEFSCNDLVVVKQFGDPIFPALEPLDSVCNTDKADPWNILIEADNYHALQLLDFLYAGKVDCIYIDPPYNTGARDWKYNNDYVDCNDGWRHSKWLAFIEKRLILAKKLLKPDNSVLVVTIDEHEVHHLGMLLKDIFPEARQQMVTIVNNAAGVSQGGFYRVEEYAFFCFLGNAKPVPGQDDYLSDAEQSSATSYWFSMIRYGGVNALPSKRANLVYPIAIDEETLKIVGVGQSLKKRVELGLVTAATNDWLPDVETINGHPVIWPFRGNGSMATWQMGEDTLLKLFEQGFVRIRKQTKGPGGNKYSISYVKSGHRKKVKEGEIPVLGHEYENGPLILGQIARNVIPKTVWKRVKHDAGKWGSRILREILGDVTFDYAKSPYSVLDCLSSVVGGKKDALILDFFSGSGTTLLATALLNLRDNGKRKCILVTNNEVSVEKIETLKSQNLQPGDEDWEKLGICRSVTWPRSKYSILGKRDDETEITGEYLTGLTKEIEISRNFTHISFATSLEGKQQKKQLVSLLKGLPQNLVKKESKYIVSDLHNASILFDSSFCDEWLDALDEKGHITNFYIVTSTISTFTSIKFAVNNLLGPIVKFEELARLKREGLPMNLAYFKLNFLQKNQVALKQAFRQILPLLWLKSGGVGERPQLQSDEKDPAFFIPSENNFAVLLSEVFLAKFLDELATKSGLSYIFIVTDADESFKEMAALAREILGVKNQALQVVQLYKDYLANFMINKIQETNDITPIGVIR